MLASLDREPRLDSGVTQNAGDGRPGRRTARQPGAALQAWLQPACWLALQSGGSRRRSWLAPSVVSGRPGKRSRTAPWLTSAYIRNLRLRRAPPHRTKTVFERRSRARRELRDGLGPLRSLAVGDVHTVPTASVRRACRLCGHDGDGGETIGDLIGTAWAYCDRKLNNSGDFNFESC
jgi:hypothetical protein